MNFHCLLISVWCVSWHSCGDFLASCSMDNAAKVWDLNSLRCRYTLRGHTDSVNSIEFLPFSNTLLTCSADKTLSLWDARMVSVFSTAILTLLLIQDGQLSVSGKRMCTSTGKLLRRLNLPGKVWFGKLTSLT